MQKRWFKTIGQRFWAKTYKEEEQNLILTIYNTIPLNFKTMSLQMTNNYMTAPTSSNPYITRKLNNMDEAKALNEEWDDWTRLYHKMLKGLETMIDVQKQVWDMIKIAEEANITITKIEEIILKESINNWTTNAMNILEILEDLWYMIQSNMEDHAYQVQHMLADKLDAYSGWGNQYINNNIKEIQELYKNREQTKNTNQEQVENEEVILIKPYKISSLSSTKSSFIDNEVNNLLKSVKFICSSIQTRIFRPPPHYQSLKSRGKKNQEF